MTTMLEIAHRYQSQGFKVYPLAPGTKIPLKDSHGFLDATTDPDTAAAWWRTSPNANIGIGLKDTGILVFDLDSGHAEGVSGVATLKRLELGPLGTTYTEQTPSGGLHVWYRYDPARLTLTSYQNIFGTGDAKTGIDVNAQGVPVAPDYAISKGTGEVQRYKPLVGRKIDVIAPVPDWLLCELGRLTRPRNAASGITSPGKKYWAGRVLDDMVNGEGTGNRNTFMTRLAGQLVRTGAEPETVWNLLLITRNNFLDLSEPFPDSEVKTIFNSVWRREERKRANAEN